MQPREPGHDVVRVRGDPDRQEDAQQELRVAAHVPPALPVCGGDRLRVTVVVDEELAGASGGGVVVLVLSVARGLLAIQLCGGRCVVLRVPGGNDAQETSSEASSEGAVSPYDSDRPVLVVYSAFCNGSAGPFQLSIWTTQRGLRA